MTWNNRLTTALTGTVGQLGPMPALNTQYSTSLNVADLAPLQGQRITVRLSSAGADNMRVFSKEFAGATQRPRLTLTYTAG